MPHHETNPLLQFTIDTDKSNHINDITTHANKILGLIRHNLSQQAYI